MSATPLTEIHLPEQAVTELSGIDVTDWIHDHAIAVGRPRWTDALTAARLDDTLTGDTIPRAATDPTARRTALPGKPARTPEDLARAQHCTPEGLTTLLTRRRELDLLDALDR